jgi:dTDP-4-dehydrorhamnose 3,5-epimerase
MRFTQLSLPGAYLIELQPHADERGFFARTFAEEEFAAHGLQTRFPQSNLSRNRKAGTLRGMHYAVAPSEETKVVRCASGAIHDVIIDLRADSPTYAQWVAVELTGENGRALYVPTGFAHGFLTLADDTDVVYQMGDVFRPETARGFRWDDPAFGVIWPHPPVVISSRDATYPDFQGRSPE